MNTTIKKQFLIFISTLILGVSFFVGFLFYSLVQDSQQEVVINLIKEKNASIQQNIEDFTLEKYQDIESNAAILEDLLRANNKTLIFEIFESLRNKYQNMHGLYWDSNDQNNIEKLSKFAYPTSDLKKLIVPSEQEPYFKILKQSSSLNSSNTYLILKNIFLKNVYHSTLVFTITSEHFQKHFGSLDGKIAGYFKPATTVATSDGMTIYRSQDSEQTNYKLQKEFYIEKGQFIHVSDNIVTVVTSTSHDDFVFETFPKWIVFSQFEKSQIDEPFEVVYYILIPSLFFILIFLLFAVNLYINHLFKPLVFISTAFKRLSEGTFERIDVQYEKNDEFGMLVKGYNQMMLQLRTTLAELNSSGKFAALGEMAAGIAHEVNNPLQIIRGYATLTPKYIEANQNEKVIENSKKIISAIDRIAKIVNSLRTYARDGAHDPFREASAFQICDDTLVFCNEKFKNHNIDFKLELPEEKIILDCRPEQISQILLNLLNNAADAISPLDEKWIRLEVRQISDSVEFKVCNSGPKIPEAIAERLFTPFFTTKEVGKGTGLGLSLSKGLAETHKGELLLDRSSPCTCFALKLPLKQKS